MGSEPFAIATATNGSPIVFTCEERERHVYIIGKSVSGKSTFLFNLAMSDILAGEGVAVIDPHGDLAEDILNAIPPSRVNEVCYLNAGETEYPVGLNPATRIAPERRALAASGIVAACKHLWSDSWGPRLEHRCPPKTALCPQCPRLCCKSRFSLVFKNSAGYRRDLRVKM